MSSTVLRVKRRLEDNPQDALVLVCKRTKLNTEDDVSPALFVFRGSVNNPESKSIKNIVPSNEKLKCPSNVSDLINKIREERKDNSAKNRYEIVNCSRGLQKETLDIDNMFDLVDITRKYNNDNNENYIYDLYTSAKDDFDITMLDDLVCIENYETDLIFGSCRDNGIHNSDDEDDDEDSNAENNYRNDYPDSDNSSINEDDIIRALERVDLDELSSDTGEDNIYDDPSDSLNEDVSRYGAAYAKYKARVLTQLQDQTSNNNLVHVVEEPQDQGYKDDSDNGFYYGEDADKEQSGRNSSDHSCDDYERQTSRRLT